MTPSKSPLHKVRRSRLSDQAAGEIKRLIARGTYAPGARLPTEKELAQGLGVTRLTVREALSRIEEAGLTQTLHGSGTYVVDAEHASLRLLAEMLRAGRDLTGEEMLGLMEFRQIVIGGFADALVRNVRGEHVQAMRRLLEESKRAHGDATRLAALDFALNEALAQASGNVFYLMLVRSLREAHEHLGVVIFRELGDDNAILATQRAMVDALAEGSGKKLSRALGVYLAGGTTLVKSFLQRRGKKGRTS